ncbi:DUF1992 domain-containing protein [Nocardioides insulae]|uniref:DnaJ family domain-containing protein n=1 Tax=Nocardioides insulae TaxID=394734 RepID=UPI0003FB7F99|nr:DUF1992 domain-containing protein [Nocardioides insulae]
MPESEDRPGGQSEVPQRGPARDARTGGAAAANRINQQTKWVDLQVKQAIERGEFDDLPGAGKPITGLGTQHDADWWLKQLVEREHITVLPLSVQLRKEDAELDDQLDRLASEDEVRRTVEEFNARVIAARYRLPEGPPLITMPRDLEESLTAWRVRREERRRHQDQMRRRLAEEDRPRRRDRWFRRR